MTTPVVGGAPRCKATKANGFPCRAFAVSRSDYCRFHDPKHRQDLLRSSALGGRSSWRKRLEEVGGDTATGALLTFLSEVMVELRTPDLSPESVVRLRACAYTASVTIRVLEVAELATELHELRQLIEVQRVNQKRSKVDGRSAAKTNAVPDLRNPEE